MADFFYRLLCLGMVLVGGWMVWLGVSDFLESPNSAAGWVFLAFGALVAGTNIRDFVKGLEG